MANNKLDFDLKFFEKESGLNTKSCPFCKKSLRKDAKDCLHCKRVLIEKIRDDNIKSKHTYEQVETGRSSALNKNITNLIEKIRSKWWLSIVIILLFFAIFGNNDTYTSGGNEKTYSRLSNGTIIHSSPVYLNGLGELTVKNGTDSDASVKLISMSNNKSIFTIYVSSNNNYTIQNISDGVYELYFQVGNDWNEENKKFQVNPQYLKFRDTFTFQTIQTKYFNHIETKYSSFEITLNPVVGGTAKTDDTSEEEFEKY